MSDKPLKNGSLTTDTPTVDKKPTGIPTGEGTKIDREAEDSAIRAQRTQHEYEKNRNIFTK